MVNLDVREIAHAMTEGIELAAYSFDRYKKQKKNHLQSFDLAVQDGRDVLASKKGMERARLFSHGTCFVRDLVNTTPHHMNPSELVQVAKKIAKESKDVRVSVYDESQLKRMGAGGIIGVAQGSTHPPYLVHLTYKPKTKTKKRIALVGKASRLIQVVFPQTRRQELTMKCDMAGAANVLGIFRLSQKSPQMSSSRNLRGC